MEKFAEIRIASYLSLIFADALSADGGYRVMSLVLFCFVVFHLIGKLAVVPANQTSPPGNLSGWRVIMYSIAVISGPWIGVLLALFCC